MNLDSIVERLVDEVAPLKLVGGAIQFAAAVDQLATAPAAFVIPGAEAGDDNPFLNQLVEQRLRVEFAVVIAVRNLSDKAGSKAYDALDPVRGPIRDALLNWTPEGAEDGCVFVRGALMDFKNGFLWWTDSFATYYTIRSV